MILLRLGTVCLALVIGATCAAAQVSDANKKRVPIDEKIFFSYWCVHATGGDWSALKDTVVDKIADVVPASALIKSGIKLALKGQSILSLKKGEARCFTHRAWKQSGFKWTTTTPTAAPQFYLKVLEEGKVISKGSWVCGGEQWLPVKTALCNRPDPLAPGGWGMDGSKSENANGVLACFEWDGAKTSDGQPRSLLVAVGKVSKEAKVIHDQHKVQIGKRCSDLPQS